jgi:RNA recognition motif-containing protein
LYGFSPEVSDSDFKDEISNQIGLTNYKLKIIKKVDEEGTSKTFGFIEFPNKQDC